MMKKLIFTIFLAILFLLSTGLVSRFSNLSLVPSAFATDLCDPTVYNKSGEYAAKTCKPGDCQNSNTPDELNLFPCWPKGTTTKDPSCPDGMGTMVTCDKICCVGYGVWPAFACNEKSGAPSPAVRDCAFIQQWAVNWAPKDKCDSGWKYDSASGKCLPSSQPTSSWDPKNKCDDGSTGVQTAVGCVPTGDLANFLAFILKFAFGISGAVVLVMVMVTGYQVLTSAGNPEKLQAAKENIVSILSGLVLIAFSLVLLQTIGGNILGLPGF